MKGQRPYYGAIENIEHSIVLLIFLLTDCVLSLLSFKRPDTLTFAEDDSNSEPVPVLPEKRKSYASTTSSRASSSVFSDTASDFPSPMSPSVPLKFQKQFPDRLQVGSSTRDSRGSTLPSGSTSSTISLGTPRPGSFTAPRPSGSGPNNYSYVTPPSSPRVPYDYVSSPNESVASWVSNSTQYFSASSSFDSDIFSPGTPPKRESNIDVPPPSPSSISRSVDLLATSPTKNDSTPPLIPFKGTHHFSTSVEKVETFSFSETTLTGTSTMTSSTEEESVDQPVKPRTPVPVPRRNTMSPSSSRPTGSLSRSRSDVSDGNQGPGRVTPPPIKPRKSTSLSSDQGPKSPPPPKPPRPSQAREPPPKPKPYASRSVENSPAVQRKAVSESMQNIPPGEKNGSWPHPLRCKEIQRNLSSLIFFEQRRPHLDLNKYMLPASELVFQA